MTMTAPHLQSAGARGREAVMAALSAARENLRTYVPQYSIAVTIGGEQRVLYRALPKQDVLHAARAPFILYGGAAGGAKSHGLRFDAYIKCLRVRGLKVLFLRRTFPELRNTHIMRIEMGELPPQVARWHKTDKRLTFGGTGSLVQFGHCEDIKALAAYLSTEWDVIYIDEASTFLPMMLNLLQTRARTTLPGIVPQFILASNPGGDAHLWLLQRFLEKSVPEDDDPEGEYDPADYLFIPSLLTDNPYIQNAYVKRLLALPKQEQDAYLYGNWTAFAGQFFRDWSPEHHVARIPKVPDWWELQGGMDWGYSPDPGCVLLGAFDEFGRGHLIRELTFRESTPRQVAEQMDAAFPEGRTRPVVIYGDTQMWKKQEHSGVSIADDINDRLAELGSQIVVVQANKDRVNGWQRVRSFLAFRPDPAPGRGAAPQPVPWLRVAQPDPATGYGCPALIASLPAQAFDDRPTHAGDMKPSATDHPADTLRYLLMAREPLADVPIEERPATTHDQRVHDRNRKILERLARAAAQQHPDLAPMPATLPPEATETAQEGVVGGNLDAFYG